MACLRGVAALREALPLAGETPSQPPAFPVRYSTEAVKRAVPPPLELHANTAVATCTLLLVSYSQHGSAEIAHDGTDGGGEVAPGSVRWTGALQQREFGHWKPVAERAANVPSCSHCLVLSQDRGFTHTLHSTAAAVVEAGWESEVRRRLLQSD